MCSLVETPVREGWREGVSRSRRVRYEADGGVRLAGGEVDQQDVNDGDEETETGTIETLPPPYSSVPRRQ